MATLEDALALALEAHRGMVDKGGAPYILHPLRLMMKMDSASAMMAAVLHDVVEDSDCNLARLRELGFGEDVVTAVDSLTRRENESYEEFIERAGRNPIGRQVKLADLEDNMDIRRIANPSAKDMERLQKYRRSWGKLVGEVE
jgi:(p)ppGpp synthase/HD superfamily hydrolase